MAHNHKIWYWYQIECYVCCSGHNGICHTKNKCPNSKTFRTFEWFIFIGYMIIPIFTSSWMKILSQIDSTIYCTLDNTLYEANFWSTEFYFSNYKTGNYYQNLLAMNTVWSEGFLYKVAPPEQKNSPIIFFVIHNSVVLSKICNM